MEKRGGLSSKWPTGSRGHRSFVGARYDRLAPIYGLFEWLYALPLVGVRRKAVEALRISLGDSVLEVGCGSGRNFALLEEKVGPKGAIYGVDMSAGMLSRAQSLAGRRGWSNVQLTCGDAAAFEPPAPIRAALFSFSYSTMRDRLSILDKVWSWVEPDGRVVITDAQLREGWPRKLFYRLGIWMPPGQARHRSEGRSRCDRNGSQRGALDLWTLRLRLRGLRGREARRNVTRVGKARHVRDQLQPRRAPSDPFVTTDGTPRGHSARRRPTPARSSFRPPSGFRSLPAPGSRT